MTKEKIKVLVGLLVSFGLVAWIYTICDWAKVWADLQTVHYWYFIPVTALVFVQFYFRTLRWRFLLPRVDTLRLRDLFDAIMLGNLATYILPLRAGEFVRPFVLVKRCNLNFSRGFVSVVIERFFDLAMVLFTFALIMSKMSNLPAWVEKGAIALSVLASGIFCFIVASVFLPNLIKKVIDYFLQFVPPKLGNAVRGITNDMIAGSSELRSLSNLTIVISLTMLIWLITYLQFQLCLMIFDEPSSFIFAVAISVFVALGVAAPSVPGFLGVFQAACLGAFIAFGRSNEQAAVYGLLVHLHQYIFVIIMGVWSMLRFGLNFSDLKRGKTLASEVA